MASPQGEVLGQPSDQGLDKAGVSYSKPPLKPKPVLPPHLRSAHVHSGSQNPCTKNISALDSSPTSPPPDLPSAVKLTQLTGPLPYGSRRPSLKRWASGGEKESNQDGSPLSPVESPIVNVSSKAAVHPVSALPKPFQPGTSWKGRSPFLLTSRGWGEQRWQQARDFPESDFSSKRHSSTIESKEETHENKMKDQTQEKAVSVTCDSNKENIYDNLSDNNKREITLAPKEHNKGLEEVTENSEKVAMSCSDSPWTSKIPRTVKNTDETQGTDKGSLPEARLSAGKVPEDLGPSVVAAENTVPETFGVSKQSLVSESSKDTQAHPQDPQTKCPKSDNLPISASFPDIGTISYQGSIAEPLASEDSKTVNLEYQEYGDKEVLELHSAKRLGHSLTEEVLLSPEVSTKVSKPTPAKRASIEQQKQPERYGLLELHQEDKYSLPEQSPKCGNMPLERHLYYGSSERSEQHFPDREMASEQDIHNKPEEWLRHKDNAAMNQIQHNRSMNSKDTEGEQCLTSPTKEPLNTQNIQNIELDISDLSSVTSDLSVEEHEKSKTSNINNTNVPVVNDGQQKKEHMNTEISMLETQNSMQPGTGSTQCDLETTAVTKISQRDIGAMIEKHTDNKTEKAEANKFDAESKYNVEEMDTLLQLPERSYSEYSENVMPTSFASYETKWSRHDGDQIINEMAGKQLEHKDDSEKPSSEGDTRLFEDYTEGLYLNSTDNKLTDHTLKPHLTQPSAYVIATPKEQHENCTEVQQGGRLEEQSENVGSYNWDSTEKGLSVDVDKSHHTYLSEKVNEGFPELQLDQTEINSVREAGGQPAENDYGKQSEDCMAFTTVEPMEENVQHESHLRSKHNEENVILPLFHTMDYYTSHITEISRDNSNNEFVDTKTPDYVNVRPEDPEQIYMETETTVQHQHSEAQAKAMQYKPQSEELKYPCTESEELDYESRYQSASPETLQHVVPESEGPENIYCDVDESPPSDKSEETKNRYAEMVEPKLFQCDTEEQRCHVLEGSHYEHIEHSKKTDTVDAESKEKQGKFIGSEKLHQTHIEKWEPTNTETPLSTSVEKDIELNKSQMEDNESGEQYAYTESGEPQDRCTPSQEVQQYNNQSHHNDLILHNIQHGNAQSHELHKNDILSPKNQYSDIQSQEFECRDYQPQEGECVDYKSQEVESRDTLQSQEAEHKNALHSQEVEHRDDLQVQEVEHRDDLQVQEVEHRDGLQVEGAEQRDAPEAPELEHTNAIQSQGLDHIPVEKLSHLENELQYKDSSKDEPDQTESKESQETHDRETESEDSQHVIKSLEPEKRKSQLNEYPPDDLGFLEGTEVLDTSLMRCRASLGRKRCHRTPPQLTSNNEVEDPEYWMFRDSTEERPEKESDCEEAEATSPECSPSTNLPVTSPGKSHTKKSGIFAGIMNPNLLKGRLKSRSKTTEEAPTKQESEEPSLSPKSCSSPEKGKSDSSSLNWLSALKKKKKKAPK